MSFGRFDEEGFGAGERRVLWDDISAVGIRTTADVSSGHGGSLRSRSPGEGVRMNAIRPATPFVDKLQGQRCPSFGEPVGARVGCAEALSSSEAQSLAFTREEEKLARDVYVALGAKDPMFSNISRSEQTHMDAVLTLLSRYGLPDPAAENARGEFEDATLQKLHDDLVLRGAPSTLAALQVGVAIEELDIRDIEAARTSVTHGVLDLPTRFATDWADKGYPVERSGAAPQRAVRLRHR
jgi:hypothetical protein